MKRTSRVERVLWILATIVCFGAAPVFVQAATKVWTGTSGVDTDWSTTANWSGGEPAAMDRAVIRVNSALSPVVTQPGENCYTMDIAWGSTSTTVGLLTIQSGDLTVNSTGIALELGGLGNGNLVQTGGALTVKGYLTLGAITSTIVGGSGTYDMSGGTLNVMNEFTIGCKGTGTFTQSDGTITAYKATYIGRGKTGTYTMSGGTLNTGTSFTTPADAFWIGYGANGSFTQTGGNVNSYGRVVVANGASTSSSYTMTGGSLKINGENSLVLGVYGGTATFLDGDASSPGYIGAIDPIATKGSFYVGGDANSAASFRGWGEVELRYIYNNGKVIGDGYGTDRLLDMSTCERVFNNWNPSTSGWYAVNHGGLVLPPISFDTVLGQVTHTWGGANIYDVAPSLVNSVSITLAHDCKGNIQGALLAADRTDLPAFGDPDAKIIGVWDFAISLDPDTYTNDLSGATIAIRYDDALAASLGLDESTLVIYQYINGQWMALTSTVNTTDKVISANTDSFSLFAVGKIASTQIPGDANKDNTVNVVDLGILATNYGVTETATWEMGDFNGDKAVNVVDLGILATHYGEGGAAYAADSAKVFGNTEAKEDTTATTGLACPAAGLPIIAGLALMGLMLVRLEE